MADRQANSNGSSSCNNSSTPKGQEKEKQPRMQIVREPSDFYIRNFKKPSTPKGQEKEKRP